MRIGELAQRAEVNIQTIRFYEKRRLLREPSRTAGGYRSYEKRDLEHLLFIKWCQRLGFTLVEVRELLPLHTALARGAQARGNGELNSIVAMAEEKLIAIDSKIDSLKQMSRQVRVALRELRKDTGPSCPASRRASQERAPGHSGRMRCPESR